MAPLLRRSIALATLAALPAITQAASLYKVEMLVFSHENPANLGEEYWPDDLPALDLSASLLPSSWDGYPLSRFEELPQNDLQLGGDAAALSRSADYKLLYHRGWLQSIGGKSRAREVRIKADFDDLQLDGSIKIYKNRFLHAQPRLEFSSTNMNGNYTAENPDTPATVSNITVPVVVDGDNTQRWRMDQSRRMRSNETHYIDHPRFGVLLRIRALN
ncbi:MAG: hypothetical protein GYB41_06770 [Oceanospirillales bacterium]|nr:hypothetical protein [Oceanospirillales bacterium]